MIQITLREGRTAEEVYSDTALVNGYIPNTTEDFITDLLTEDQKNAFEYPEGTTEDSKKIQAFTQDDKTTILYKTSYTVESPNPETEQEFGQKIVAKIFGKMDSDTEGKAATIRAKKKYNVSYHLPKKMIL